MISRFLYTAGLMLTVLPDPAAAETRILFCSDKAVNGSFDLFSMSPAVSLVPRSTAGELLPCLRLEDISQRLF